MASFIIAYQKSPNTIQKFRDNFKEKLEQIKKLPFSCPKSNKLKGTRKARFDKYGAFLYFVFNKTVFIVTFYDSRMK